MTETRRFGGDGHLPVLIGGLSSALEFRSIRFRYSFENRVSCLSLGPPPKWACLADFFHCCDHLPGVFPLVRYPIRVQPLPEIAARKQFDQIAQGDDSFLSSFLEIRPIANMLFRPEEIHCASGIGRVFEPFPEGNSDISDHAFRFRAQDAAVTHFQNNRKSAVKTWTIHPNRLAGEKPADRQRFKASLAEPFLLAVYGYPVLGWQVVERSKGRNQAGVRKEPPRNSRLKQSVKGFSPLFHGEAQFAGQFGVMWGLAGFHHAFHDEVKRSIQHILITHRTASFVRVRRSWVRAGLALPASRTQSRGMRGTPHIRLVIRTLQSRTFSA